MIAVSIIIFVLAFAMTIREMFRPAPSAAARIDVAIVMTVALIYLCLGIYHGRGL